MRTREKISIEKGGDVTEQMYEGGRASFVTELYFVCFYFVVPYTRSEQNEDH